MANKHMNQFNLSYNERDANQNIILLFICQIGTIKINGKTADKGAGCLPAVPGMGGEVSTHTPRQKKTL